VSATAVNCQRRACCLRKQHTTRRMKRAVGQGGRRASHSKRSPVHHVESDVFSGSHDDIGSLSKGRGTHGRARGSVVECRLSCQVPRQHGAQGITQYESTHESDFLSQDALSKFVS
jgi:hypothetical protein